MRLHLTEEQHERALRMSAREMAETVRCAMQLRWLMETGVLHAAVTPDTARKPEREMRLHLALRPSRAEEAALSGHLETLSPAARDAWITEACLLLDGLLAVGRTCPVRQAAPMAIRMARTTKEIADPARNTMSATPMDGPAIIQPMPHPETERAAAPAVAEDDNGGFEDLRGVF